jgi:hypothetical protein
MKKNERLLRSAIRKCSRFAKTKQYCGNLTPSEIFTLIDAGVKPIRENHHIEWLKKNLNEGQSNPIWFYFYPNGVVMDN